jgi:hypothetical protein
MALGSLTRTCALVVAGSVALAAAQQAVPSPPGPGSGILLGRVLDAQSGLAVSGVFVSLAGPGGPPRVCLADGQGRFAFRDLPKGRFDLTASVGGNGFSPNGFVVTGLGFPIGSYLPGGFGQRRPDGPLVPVVLPDAARLTDVVIRLWKPAVIAGTVIDEADEPQIGQVVGVVRVNSDGRLVTGPTARTDDRGAYRFSVSPGTYLVVVPQTQLLIPAASVAALGNGADPTAAARLAMTGAPAARDGVTLGQSRLVVGPDRLIANSVAPHARGTSWLWTPTTFAPSALAAAGAARLAVEPGEERSGVVVRIQPVATYAVAGTLTDPVGPVAGFGVHLLPAGTEDGSAILEVARTSTDAQGRFIFPAVPPGVYTVVSYRIAPVPSADRGQPAPIPRTVSEEPGAWASQAVVVGGDVAGLTLAMRAGTPMEGELVFAGTAPVPAADRWERLGLGVVAATPTFRYDGSPRSTVTVDATNHVSIGGLPPGRYLVRVPDVSGWTLESTVLGTRDVTDAVFSMETVEGAKLVITLTDRAGTLTGTVLDGRNVASPEATVVIFPADRSRWPDAAASTRTFREVRTSTGGQFALGPLPAGDYLVAAVDGASDGTWPDVSFLSRVASGATAATIRAGQAPSLTLKLLDLR